LETIKKNLASGSVAEQLKRLVEESNYEAYLYECSDNPAKAQKQMDNVWELLEWIQRLLTKDPDHSLADVINKLILIDILEQTEEHDKETVQLMTLHASKGLEFPYVYLVGMEEDLLPHRVSVDEEQLEEERRLAYVGLTRAQKGLCFTLARQRRKAGELQDCLPSRFLEELPEDSLEWFGIPGTSHQPQSQNMAQSHLAGLKNLLQME